MRDVSKAVAEGDIIDIFNLSVNLMATNERRQIVGYYDLAAINISYNLKSITDNTYTYYPSLITTSAEGKCRVA